MTDELEGDGQERELEPAGVGAGEHAGGGPPEPPPPAPARSPAPRPAGVAYNDRVFLVGMTGSGKSELLNHQLSVIRCQRLLLDTKDEFSVPGAEPARDPAALDWSLPLLHYIPSRADYDEFDALFEACFSRRHLTVAVHELGDLCNFKPGATPPQVVRYINQGRAHGLGLLGGSQRPVAVPMHSRTEAGHVFMFVPSLTPDDHRAVARTIGLAEQELRAALDDLHTRAGDHAFMWWDRRTRELTECPPLPEHVRAQTVVTRRTVA